MTFPIKFEVSDLRTPTLSWWYLPALLQVGNRLAIPVVLNEARNEKLILEKFLLHTSMEKKSQSFPPLPLTSTSLS